MSLSEYILDVDEATFELEVVLRSHEVPVVVDFWAPWCGPCRMLSPMLERKAIEGGGSFLLAKVNVDDNPALSIRFGVQGIPAVKAFAQGEVAAEFVGAQSESMVDRFIKQLAPSATQQAVEEALSLLGTRHYQEAEQAFREVLSEDEANADAALGLVESLLMRGKGAEAPKPRSPRPNNTKQPRIMSVFVLTRPPPMVSPGLSLGRQACIGRRCVFASRASRVLPPGSESRINCTDSSVGKGSALRCRRSEVRVPDRDGSRVFSNPWVLRKRL